jgi:hypothetical protein
MNVRTFTNFLLKFLVCILLLGSASCDVFESDTIQPEKQVEFRITTFYTIQGSSIVIDLQSIVRESFVDASLSINQPPLQGSLIQLDPYLLKYTPSPEFSDGEDHFKLGVIKDGKLIKSQVITILSKQSVNDLPCTYYAINDHVVFESGANVSVNVVSNDRVCGISQSDLKIAIHMQPKNGLAEVVDNSIIHYEPGFGFNGKDELVYKVSLPDDTILGFGILSLSDRQSEVDPVVSPEGWIMEVTELPFEESPFTTALWFSDENTGYAGMVDGVYKTIDGGAHWEKIFKDSDYRHGGFTINFSDPLNGCVSYFVDDPYSFGYYVIRTTDGGQTWKKINIEDLVIKTAPNFISSFTGFTSGTTSGGYWDNDYQGKILRTTDGGSSWKEVLNLHNHTIGIPFIAYEQLLGYAEASELDSDGEGFVSNKIYITNDGGETWDMLIRDAENYINSVVLHPDNSLYVASEPINSTSSRTSSIRKFTQLSDKSSLTQVAYFPYAITSLKFSPSGTVGITVGIKGLKHDASSHNLGINMSFDRGATWHEVIPQYQFLGFTNAGIVAVLSDHLVYFRVDNKLVKFWHP